MSPGIRSGQQHSHLGLGPLPGRNLGHFLEKLNPSDEECANKVGVIKDKCDHDRVTNGLSLPKTSPGLAGKAP